MLWGLALERHQFGLTASFILHTGHEAALLVVPEARQASKLQAGRYVVRGLPKELTEGAQGGSLSRFFCCLKLS
jgi:hypothetical protein